VNGGLVYQVHELFKFIDHRGEKKGAAKKAFYEEVRADKEKVKVGLLAATDRLKGTISNLADRLGVYGNKTADKVRDEWLKLAKYALSKSGVGVKRFDFSAISTEIIKEYLIERFQGLERRTCQNYTGYLVKYALAIKEINGIDRIKEIREICTLALPPELARNMTSLPPKNHINPQKVLKCLENIAKKTGNENAYKSYLASKVLYESGCRVRVATLISQTGKTQIQNDGVMSYKTKAGQEGSTRLGNLLSQNTVRLVRDYRASHEGVFKLDDSTYNRWLHKAEVMAGDRVLGAHAWRYDRAYEVYTDCRVGGMNDNEALRYVAETIDHHRKDITLHYLQGCSKE
jgi:integrase